MATTPNLTRPTRRRRWAALTCAAVLAGCASPPPPPRLYQLRALAVPAAAPATPVGPWALGPVTLPEYLDRTPLLRRRGLAGLQAMDGHRWAEPLAEAVPRVLRQALEARWGTGQVWATPLPAGVRAARQLRVELLRFEADEAELVLQARWAVLAPGGDAPPRVHQQDIRVPLVAADPDTLAAAHAQAVDRLAAAIVEAAR